MVPSFRRHLTAIIIFGIPFGASAASVNVEPGGPIVIRTPKAEFHILATGYCSGFLLNEGEKLTLNDPTANDSSGSIRIDGKPVGRPAIDFARSTVTDTGTHGKQ